MLKIEKIPELSLEMALFEFRVVLCRIRIFSTFISKIK